MKKYEGVDETRTGPTVTEASAGQSGRNDVSLAAQSASVTLRGVAFDPPAAIASVASAKRKRPGPHVGSVSKKTVRPAEAEALTL